MIARLLVLLTLLLATPAAAESLAGHSLKGSWALAMDGTPIFRFDLAQDDKGQWHGTWSRPSAFASDGDHFRRLSGPVKQVHSATGISLPDGTIEVSFNDPRPGAIPDIFDFRPIDADAVQMTYVGTGLAPYTLDRVKPDVQLGPWDPTRTYGREVAAKEPDQAPKIAPEQVLDNPAPIDSGAFKLPPGAPVGR